MLFLLKIIVAVMLVVSAIWWIRRGFRAQHQSAHRALQARREFDRNRVKLAEAFFDSSDEQPVTIALTDGPLLLVRDRHAGELYALADATCSVELEREGPSVRAPNTTEPSTAIFRWTHARGPSRRFSRTGGGWHATGRLLKNMSPEQALVRYRTTLTKVS